MQDQNQTTYSNFGEKKMKDVYELEEYHHDGSVGGFVKTRKCGEDLFEELILSLIHI